MSEAHEGEVATETRVGVRLDDRIVSVEANDLIRMMDRSGVLPGGQGGALARLILDGKIETIRIGATGEGEDDGE